MKKRVKQYAQQIELGTQDRQHVLKDFSRMLDNQVYSLSCLAFSIFGLFLVHFNFTLKLDSNKCMQGLPLFTLFYVKNKLRLIHIAATTKVSVVTSV